MWENQGGRFGLRIRRVSCAKPHHIPSDIPDHLPTGREGFHIWSECYDREMEDVFAIQDDISRAIMMALRVQLGMTEAAPLVTRPRHPPLPHPPRRSPSYD